MKTSISHIARLLLLVVITFTTTYAYAGLPKLIGPRKWSEQRVTWDDFQILHIKTDTLRPTHIDLGIETETKTAFIGNTRFEYTQFEAYMNPTSSWYDPDKVSKWDLITNNILFDICELNVRLRQREYNKNYDIEFRDNTIEHAMNEATQRFKEFALKTDYQKDTAAISRFAQDLKRELRMLPPSKPTIPLTDYQTSFGFRVGYLRSNPIGRSSSKMNNLNEIDLGMLFGFWKVDVEICTRTGSFNVFESCFDNAYDWNNQTARLLNNSINIGYHVYSGQYFKIVPFTGIGLSSIHQINDDGQDKNKANGFSLDAGVNADYILFRDLHASSPSYEYYLRLKPFVSYTRIGGETIWSANISLSLGFNVLFPEGMSTWRMF